MSASPEPRNGRTANPVVTAGVVVAVLLFLVWSAVLALAPPPAAASNPEPASMTSATTEPAADASPR